MLGLEFRSLASTSVLRAIGRKVLAEFLAKFEAEIRAGCVPFPEQQLSDEDYFTAVAGLLSAPEHLPDRLNQVLLTIEEISSDENSERLDAVLAQAGIGITFDRDSPPERLSLQVWLQSPDLVSYVGFTIIATGSKFLHPLAQLLAPILRLRHRPKDQREHTNQHPNPSQDQEEVSSLSHGPTIMLCQPPEASPNAQQKGRQFSQKQTKITKRGKGIYETSSFPSFPSVQISPQIINHKFFPHMLTQLATLKARLGLEIFDTTDDVTLTNLLRHVSARFAAE